jgi:FkbM family methyltransferase
MSQTSTVEQTIEQEHSAGWLRSQLSHIRVFCGAHRFPGADRLSRILSARGLPNRTVICSVLGNRRLIVDPSQDEYQRRIFLTGDYETGTLYFMEQVLRPGDIFIDAGANLGLMTIHASHLVGKQGAVVAFEPSPVICRRLRQNLILNSCDNVEVHEIALGDERRMTTLYEDPRANIGQASLIRTPGTVPLTEVSVHRLDDCIQPIHRPRIRLIKIDVEGYELPVLRGARELLTTEPRPILCVEYGDGVSHGRFMESVGGYRLYVFADSKFSKCALVPWRDEMRLRLFDNVIYIPQELTSTMPKTLLSVTT